MVRIFFGCALACAVLIMGSFISMLRLSIQQGESLREVQRLHKVSEALDLTLLHGRLGT